MNTITSLTPTHPLRQRRGRGFWIGRVLLGLLALLFALAATGTIYQAVATTNDKRTFLPPG